MVVPLRVIVELKSLLTGDLVFLESHAFAQNLVAGKVQSDGFADRSRQRLVESPQAFCFGIDTPSFGDEDAPTGLRFEHTIADQFCVGLGHGIVVDEPALLPKSAHWARGAPTAISPDATARRIWSALSVNTAASAAGYHPICITNLRRSTFTVLRISSRSVTESGARELFQMR